MAARTLRKNMTPEERHLWYDFLRDYPIRFLRQKVVDNYIVDFYCREANLVIEIDGRQHLREAIALYDAKRTEVLKQHGLTVLRFSNIDINYNLENIGKKTTNNLIVEGALDNNSKKNFRGIIDFKEGATSSIGQENENCILLSDTCRTRSLPALLCHEEDVVGAHGESSGKIPKEKLFYLMSRGYTEKEAEKLIVIANFNSIINKINDEETKQELLDKINELI